MKRKSEKPGKPTLVSVENITPFGIWLWVQGREYFLSYREFPYFKGVTIGELQEVTLLHEVHLYWPSLDIDLEIDNLEHPEKYPLKSNGKLAPKVHVHKKIASR